MRKTPGKSKAVLVTCLLLLFIFTMPAMAWPPPCPGCCYWDGYTCWPDNSACAPCNSCISCECEWDCITGATCCNGSCCDSGNCCNSTTCCSNSDDVCCTDSNSYCCQSGKTCCQGTCCDPSLCQDCNSTTGQCESICDPNTESCCDGTCCNTSTQKCCDDIGGSNDGYCCDPNDICCKGNCCDPNLCQDCNSATGQCESICDPNTEFCCDGTCCKNCQCCIDGNCIDPQCDNCHVPPPTIQYECGHEESSTNCDTSYCMKNVLDTATCDFHGEPWPCDKRNCDTAPDGDLHAVEQTEYLLTGICPTGGDPVVPTHWVTYYHGCGGSCWANTFNAACQIDTCDTSSPMGDPAYLGQKYKCGCP